MWMQWLACPCGVATRVLNVPYPLPRFWSSGLSGYDFSKTIVEVPVVRQNHTKAFALSRYAVCGNVNRRDRSALAHHGLHQMITWKQDCNVISCAIAGFKHYVLHHWTIGKHKYSCAVDNMIQSLLLFIF
jgi:hypothetical protein